MLDCFFPPPPVASAVVSLPEPGLASGDHVARGHSSGRLLQPLRREPLQKSAALIHIGTLLEALLLLPCSRFAQVVPPDGLQHKTPLLVSRGFQYARALCMAPKDSATQLQSSPGKGNLQAPDGTLGAGRQGGCKSLPPLAAPNEPS